MTTTLPRPLPSSGLLHEAYLYDDRDEFLAGTLPFIAAGVDAGEAVLVAVSGERIELLRAELGARADAVGFAHMGELGRNPARIIPAWREFVDEHPGRPLRGIGEPAWPGRGAAELDECRLHEALLNVAFADDAPWRLRCPYDVAGLPSAVVDEAHRTHPYVRRDGDDLLESAAYRGLDGSADLFGEPLPELAEVPVEIPFTAGPVGPLRATVSELSRVAGLSEAAMDDLLLAVTEVATNSMRHGGGRGLLRLWSAPDALLVEVRDAGRIASPLAGRVCPSLDGVGGRGLWLANQLCDLVQVRSDADGTVVRLHARR